MPVVRASIRTSAAPSSMFGVLVDPANLPVLYRRLTLTPAGPIDRLREGTTFEARYLPVAPSVLEFSPPLSVAEATEPTALVLSADPWLRWEWTVAEARGGSLIQLEHRFELIWSGTFGDVLGRLLTPRVQRDARRTVETARALAEAGERRSAT